MKKAALRILPPAVTLAITVLSAVAWWAIAPVVLTHEDATARTLHAQPEADIREVILQANRQQEQAIAARDSSVMRDTATDRYYREMVLVNQSLLQSGVQSVTLIDIEWGTISVIGDTATAVTDETWTATFVDGTTRQSRDRNLYYLVLENGRWLVEADEHPDDRTPLRPGDRQV